MMHPGQGEGGKTDVTEMGGLEWDHVSTCCQGLDLTTVEQGKS
jgi:hypothetical protein